MSITSSIILASTSRHKLGEFQKLFALYPEIKIIPAQDRLRNPEKIGEVEIFNTYLENAAAKARLVHQGTHATALADDTGLEVDALDGRPGVRSHRFAPAPKPGTNMNQDQANVALLLEELKRRPNAPRTARFVCELALALEGLLIHARGVLEGTIGEEPKGGGGFGYDCLFIPEGATKTLAELSANEKNSISHRARAVHELMAQIRNLGIT